MYLPSHNAETEDEAGSATNKGQRTRCFVYKRRHSNNGHGRLGEPNNGRYGEPKRGLKIYIIILYGHYKYTTYM